MFCRVVVWVAALLSLTMMLAPAAAPEDTPRGAAGAATAALPAGTTATLPQPPQAAAAAARDPAGGGTRARAVDGPYFIRVLAAAVDGDPDVPVPGHWSRMIAGALVVVVVVWRRAGSV